ncbi:hypothetical protein [Leifsonia sp. WHRI 6310E]|uniref:hypothetical protein n=1 Tax=Leifsonia sp. WHRI 6310E TaxID=3162562 RepID=UPI0032EDA659
MADRFCLQCNESEGAIRESQRRRDPIYCGAVDYFGEVEWDLPRHRFRDRSDRELVGLHVLPEHFDEYRRLLSPWEINDAHRDPEWTGRKSHDSGMEVE